MCTKYSNIARQKKNEKKTAQLTKHDAFLYWSSSCAIGGGRQSGSLADATQDCSTSEDFSTRTVLTKNICRCVHHILQHFLTTMPFLTVSAMTYSWMASTAPQADSWWLGHVEPDDVVIADIAGQALDIFLHGPESAHKNGIGKTFTHTSIPIHHAHSKKMQKQQQQNAQLTKHDAFVYWTSSCAVCWWPIFRKLGTCSTTDALSPRTLLTENICESVQQILQHSTAEKKERKKPLNSPNMMPFFTGPLPVQSAWRMPLRTVPLGSTSRLGQYWQKTFVDVFTTYCNIFRQQCPF